jgi:hypothetical protein
MLVQDQIEQDQMEMQQLEQLEQLEQVAQDKLVQLNEDFQKANESFSAVQKASKSMNDKARILIASAERESAVIVEDAKSEAEAILAVAMQEIKRLKAEQKAFVQAAKNEAVAILTGAAEEAKRLKAVQTALFTASEQKAQAALAVAVEEIKKWEAEKRALAGVQHFEPIVKLDVGGVRVITSLKTLRRFPNTVIGCMFSGRHALPKGGDGYFFIDRDGTHFRHILNFLRSPESYKVEVDGADARELRRECKYYGIDQLMSTSTEIS